MKSVPGEIELFSKITSDIWYPKLLRFSIYFENPLALKKRLVLYWFILALGADPSRLKNKNFFGPTRFTR